jgi:hypothetical protein
MSEEETKFTVDDDWKSQVEQEKQTSQKDEPSDPDGSGQDENASQLPEASITTLITTLAMQAGVAMGQFPDPATGQPQINKPLAKHFIDSLAVLEEKTKGNLEKEEEAMLHSTVHQFRMAFISMPDSVPVEDTSQNQPEKKSTIELP